MPAETSVVGRPTYLSEVQGLRVVAALLVAIYHIWLHRVSGGVDVFFVVAAYFLTASLLWRDPVGWRHIVEYYASTARRVVPGTAIVVVATSLAAIALMPEYDWGRQVGHAFASLAYVENWKLVQSGADYLERGLDASVFQQMWALSLQMQVYLVFPLIYGAASLFARRSKTSSRRWAVVLFGLTFTFSLAYSLYLTGRNQSDAYFDSFTRVWEFAAGSLLALAIHRVQVSKIAARILGWFGLVTLVLLGMTVNVAAQFPGYLAGIPVLAALAVIVASANGANLRILANRPMTAAADLSFAFYLWHWPLLIFVRYRLGSDDIGAWGFLVLVGAALLAFASTRYLEKPFRQWHRLNGRSIAALAVCVGILLFACLAPVLWNMSYTSRLVTAKDRVEALLANPIGTVAAAGELIPAAIIAREDNPGGYTDGCHQTQRSAIVLTCVYGDHAASRTVLLVGGSHSLQWLPALDAIGRANGLRVVSMTKSACLFITGKFGNSTCPKWNEQAMQDIRAMAPDLVVTIGSRASHKNGKLVAETVPEGYLVAWQTLRDDGINVLAIRDNPRFPYDVLACVTRNSHDWGTCDRPRKQELAPVSPTDEVIAPNVRFADFSDLYCSVETCITVDNGVLIYRDRHHLTKTFVLLHRDRLEAEILAAMTEKPLNDSAT
jgi:peptidoglycan/LPS O-acetylase OafA/YrhL